MRLLVTGGCGFIGSNFVRFVLEHYQQEFVTNVDVLTYAGNPNNLADVPERYGERYEFFQADIADRNAMGDILEKHKFYAVVNFAAESHVDRSIFEPGNFHPHERRRDRGASRDRAQAWREAIPAGLDRRGLRLAGTDGRFTEMSPLDPSSPYSASKASADLLALAAHKTFGQEVVITRCSNNYGPYQFPEKLIPLMITSALADRKLPVYGDGLNVRDWIHVEDHCRAVMAVLLEGRAGEVYNIGADAEMENIAVVELILETLGKPHDLISYVADRLGHDRRYAIDSAKIRSQLGWEPLQTPREGIRQTVQWYLANRHWWEHLLPQAS